MAEGAEVGSGFGDHIFGVFLQENGCYEGGAWLWDLIRPLHNREPRGIDPDESEVSCFVGSEEDSGEVFPAKTDPEVGSEFAGLGQDEPVLPNNGANGGVGGLRPFVKNENTRFGRRISALNKALAGLTEGRVGELFYIFSGDLRRMREVREIGFG